MRRPKLSSEYRNKILQQIDKNNQYEERKRRLYNKIYRKSFIFIGAWAIRIIYFTLFMVVALTYHHSKDSRKEKLLEKKGDTISVVSKLGLQSLTTLYLKTNEGSYSSNVGDIFLPPLNNNDTIIIERNIYNKPISFSKEGWNVKYSIDANFVLYYIILFLTFISFFFNNGLEPFTTKILYLCYVIDIVTIALFFTF